MGVVKNLSFRSYKLCVVIVNYRTPQLTVNSLQSLLPEIKSVPLTKVIVVDNNSEDDSLTIIEKAIATNHWQESVSIIASNINGGFAYGNNLAIRSIIESGDIPKYFLLLNPDTIVKKNALQVLVKFMDNNLQVGIAGSRLENIDGTPQNSAFRFRTILSEIDSGLRLGLISKILSQWVVAPPISNENCQTDWVAGASMIIRYEVFKDIGLLDEGYFMYCEEMDFCLQAKKAGWSCWYIPESKIIHLVGKSSGVNQNDRNPSRRPKYWFDSRRRYFLKNYGWLYSALTDLAWLLSFSIWKVRKFIQRKPDRDPPYLLTDFFFNTVFFHPLL